MLIRQNYISVYNLAKPALFKDTLAMMAPNLNRLLCSLHAMEMAVINYHSSNWKIQTSMLLQEVMRVPTKHEANINSWMTIKLSENYPTEVVRKPSANNHKILFLSVCCSSEE
jgi:hypothetical protein